MKSVTVCVVALLIGGITLVAQSRGAQAEGFFEAGRADFDARRWEPAAAQFEQSYRFHPDPLTAYFLCLTYAHLERAVPTRDFKFGAQHVKTKVFMMAPPNTPAITIDVVDYMWEPRA